MLWDVDHEKPYQDAGAQAGAETSAMHTNICSYCGWPEKIDAPVLTEWQYGSCHFTYGIWD